MRVANVNVQIIEGRETDNGHVVIPHGTQYRLKLANYDHFRRSDATVVIDGKEVGAWRLDAGQTIVLERPQHDTGRFTFHEAASTEGQAGGAAGVGAADRGLVQVTFRMERRQPPRPYGAGGQSVVRSMHLRPASTPTCADIPEYGGGARGQSFQNEIKTGCSLEGLTGNEKAGITTLTGQSDQRFHEVAPLDYDPALEVTVSIRLVSGPAVRPLLAVPRGNPVPAPLNE